MTSTTTNGAKEYQGWTMVPFYTRTGRIERVTVVTPDGRPHTDVGTFKAARLLIARQA